MIGIIIDTTRGDALRSDSNPFGSQNVDFKNNGEAELRVVRRGRASRLLYTGGKTRRRYGSKRRRNFINGIKRIRRKKTSN